MSKLSQLMGKKARKFNPKAFTAFIRVLCELDQRITPVTKRRKKK